MIDHFWDIGKVGVLVDGQPSSPEHDFKRSLVAIW